MGENIRVARLKVIKLNHEVSRNFSIGGYAVTLRASRACVL